MKLKVLFTSASGTMLNWTIVVVVELLMVMMMVVMMVFSR